MAICRTDLPTISHTLFRLFGSHSSIASGDSDRFSAVFRDSRLIAVKSKSLALHHSAIIAATNLALRRNGKEIGQWRLKISLESICNPAMIHRFKLINDQEIRNYIRQVV
jgi:hypothetical protein